MKQLFLTTLSLLLLFTTACEKTENGPEECDCRMESFFESTQSDINTTSSLIKVFAEATPNDISFADESVGYIAGSLEQKMNTAVMAKTTDGGNNWKAYPVFVDGYEITNLEKIYALNKEVIYATFSSTRFNGVCVSKDGGCSWTKTNSLIATSFFFTTPEIGFMATQEREMHKTEDGGKTWLQLLPYPEPEIKSVNDFLFASEKIGYAYAGSVGIGIDGGFFPSGGMLKTTNGGKSWTNLTAWNEQEWPVDVTFANIHTGYAFTFDNHVYKTTDGGDSWALIKEIPAGNGSYSTVLTESGIYMSTANKLLRTKDDFTTIETLLDNDSFSLGEAVQIAEKNLFVLSAQNNAVIKIKL